MKFLVLGATGMAGHTIAIYLWEQGHDVTTYSRTSFPFGHNITGDVTDSNFLRSLLQDNDFDVVINCIGVLNNACDANPAQSILLNSYLPHAIVALLENQQTKLIHLSTDCVFSGQNAPYHEKSMRDGETFYDRTKGLGEIERNKHLTFRNSIIGPDLKQNGIGLFNWFMQQDGPINGYTGAIWTGVTTITLAKAIERATYEELTGLYHLVHTSNISKYELLQLCNRHFLDSKLDILPYQLVNVNKTLLNTRNDFSFVVPSYEEMIVEMKEWVLQHKDLYPHYFRK
ncbi:MULTISPECIES: SDR family oxidoreductase [Lysinibacillus]|uniref:dTDP-4-dehydrorhamnose reductase n=1 Tax=Lysinibacillus irui TaxID=2998077 RepID=A0AAJ5RPG1_9BACI|nr:MULTISPECIES: sugar nucleotide-binding protein [Lysinibacillus]MEA0563649.1 sugar nucleotide-binding protein [Lysinibacillus irui]WDV05344.1 sugar nucleotide-binding protein [Lysinibacillus irui]